jgi:hypothetical protein
MSTGNPRCTRVERRVLNVLLFFCKKAKFIKVIHSLDIQRTQSLSAEADVEQIQMNLLVSRKAARYQRRGPIALMDIPSRFRWLTALRSSVIQTSRPHPIV